MLGRVMRWEGLSETGVVCGSLTAEETKIQPSLNPGHGLLVTGSDPDRKVGVGGIAPRRGMVI